MLRRICSRESCEARSNPWSCERLEELDRPRELVRGQGGDQLGEGDVGADVAAATRPEPVGVGLVRSSEGTTVSQTALSVSRWASLSSAAILISSSSIPLRPN